MLKLTNSFCRYLNCLVSESKSFNQHIKETAQLSRGKTCGTAWFARTALFHTSTVLRKKKCYRIKIPPFTSNEFKTDGQMSSQPTSNHACHGAIFDVSSDDSQDGKGIDSGHSHSGDNEEYQPQDSPSDFRVWEPVSKRRDNRHGAPFRFRVVSYNVLAQYLLECHPYLYTDCCPLNLKWKVRAARLYEEIMKMAPDILCLQEVQASHISSFYSKFEQIGYFGIYKQKTGHRQDGCAIYFKQSLFELQEHLTVEYYQPELPILNRDNIGLMVKLTPRNLPDCPIVVATTHLLYNPKRTDVRLAQMQLLLAEIDRFSYYDTGKESGHFPIIITGDFNSMPESAVIELLDKGSVRASPFRDNSDWKRIGVTDNCQHLSVYLNRQQGRTANYNDLKIYNSDYCESQPDPENIEKEMPHLEQFKHLFNSDKLSQLLNLVSAYDRYKSDGEEEASTYQDYWVTVDYIYFSCCTALQLSERLRLPTVSECDLIGRLPSDVYGSDHFALAAIFELKPYRANL